MKDLFGNEIADQEDKAPEAGRFQWYRRFYHYRKSFLESRCSDCVYFKRVGDYFKCKKMGESQSAASDIRASHICDNFSKKGAQ